MTIIPKRSITIATRPPPTPPLMTADLIDDVIVIEPNPSIP